MLLHQDVNGIATNREMGLSENTPSFLIDFKDVRDQLHDEGTKLERNGASSDLVLRERANKGYACDEQIEVEEGSSLAISA